MGDAIDLLGPGGHGLEQGPRDPSPAVVFIDVEVPDGRVALRQAVRLVDLDTAADEADKPLARLGDEGGGRLALEHLLEVGDELSLGDGNRNDPAVD
jgi:hypothetical protein